MRTAARLTALLAIGTVTAVASAFAQPVKPGPDGWTTGSGGSTIPGAGSSAPLQPAAGTSAAAPVQPAQGPPGTVPSRPPVPGAGGPDTGDPSGPFLVGSVGLGLPFAMADLQLGWRIGPQFSPFVSLSGVALLAEEGGSVRLTGAGARLWFDRLFLEGRVVAASTRTACDFDEQCSDGTVSFGMFGIGGAVIRGSHMGLELRAAVLSDGRDTLVLGTLGLAFYP